MKALQLECKKGRTQGSPIKRRRLRSKWLLLAVVVTLTVTGQALSAKTATSKPSLVSGMQGVPKLQWNQTYGTDETDEYATSMIQTADGGFALAGTRNQLQDTNYDFLFLKITADGTLEWNKTYAGFTAFSILQTADGGYAIAAHSKSSSDKEEAGWLIKTSTDGIEEWNRTYGNKISSLIGTADGGYAMVVYTGTNDGNDYWLVKTKADGTQEWNRTYRDINDHFLREIIQADDGGYALIGSIDILDIGDDDGWLVKAAADGTEEWNLQFGGAKTDRTNAVIQTGDGGYAIAGTTKSFGSGYNHGWLVKTAADGSFEWNRTYGGTKYDVFESLIQTADGGFLLAGSTVTHENGYLDGWLVKTAADGSFEWNSTYGGEKSDGLTCMIQTADGGIAFAGAYRYCGEYCHNDVWLVKLGPLPLSAAGWMNLEIILVILIPVSVFRIKRKRTINSRSS